MELSNAKPIEIEVTNRTEVAIAESVTLDVQTYVQPLDVRIVTTGYAPADGPLTTPKPTTSKQGNYDLIFDASQARAIKEFPWSANAQSAGNKRMAEIDAQLERTKDPLFNNPEKTFLIAQRVAQEFAAKKRKP